MGRLVLDLPYLNWAEAKGKRYWYYRRNKQRVSLPDPSAQDFRQKYDAVHARFEAKLSAVPSPILSKRIGPFFDFVQMFKKSGDFTELAEASRYDYGRYLDMMTEMWGDLRPKEITRAALLAARDEMKSTPRQANYFMTVARRLFYWAEDREIPSAPARNPARKPKQLKEKRTGNRAWTDEEIEAYWNYHSDKDTRLMAAALGLYAAQRRGDSIARNKTHYNGAEVVAIAHKNNEPLWLPVMPPLKAVLDRVMPTRFMMLQDDNGKPFKKRAFSKWFLEGTEAAGLKGVTYHGLRTTAAEICSLFCTDATLMTIFGWKTPKMAAYYRRRAEKRKLAAIGMSAWAERMKAEVSNQRSD